MKAEHRTRCIRPMMQQGGLAEVQAGILVDAGYQTATRLRAATNDELLSLDGIGSVTVRKVREWIGE